MKRHLATPESIKQFHESRQKDGGEEVQMVDGLTKPELRTALATLSDSDYTVPAELIPKTPS